MIQSIKFKVLRYLFNVMLRGMSLIRYDADEFDTYQSIKNIDI